MKFSEKLDNYMEELGMSNRELAQRCHTTDASISRYRRGSRVPDANDGIIYDIAVVLADTYDDIRNSGSYSATHKLFLTELPSEDATSPDCIYRELISTLPNVGIDRDIFHDRFRTLISELDIRLISLSKAINYDSSFISRVLSGSRQPADYVSFASSVSDYIASLCRNRDTFLKLGAIMDMADIDPDRISYSPARLSAMIRSYLLTTPVIYDDSTGDNGKEGGKEPNIYEFVKRIDDFNLNDYVRTTHYDKLVVPTISLHLPTSRRYFGEDGMKSAELDFLRAAALLPAGADVYMYSDMPMDSLANDKTFAKRFVLGMASVLKKGHKVHQIHDLDRPASEMMEGLIGWVPLYMTGQIDPYYMPDNNNKLYRRLIRYTDSAALWGECTGSDLSTASFYGTRNRSELPVYKGRCEHIFDSARPLMNIYTKENQSELYSFLHKVAASEPSGGFRRILSAPPLHTITDDLLERIASDNNISDTTDMLRYLDIQRSIFEDATGSGTITEYFPLYDKDEFNSHPVTLSLSGLFMDSDIMYTYDTYMEHMELTRRAAALNEHYEIYIKNRYPFRNIQITTDGDKMAMVSKNTVPAIHFVIHHPILVRSILNLMEEETT